jgi:chromosome segregation ATPase
MGITHYESQEEMDDAFEDMMENEQEKARLREEIEHAEHEVESRHDDWVSANEELAELRKELEQLEAS